MTKIQDIINKYKNKIDYFDLEILIANSLDKTREFILTYPEFVIPSLKIENLKLKISRRMRGEPIAHILGHKEFYGLDFIINKHTLVPRPETEQMVELVLSESPATIVDIGTGSGCIIISIAHTSKNDARYYATDVSKDALTVAKKNAKLNMVNEKIKFLHGSLLDPFLKNKKLLTDKLVITANLPYLSREIYDAAPVDVKKFEPKSALYSAEQGLQHYRKLLEQLSKLLVTGHWSPASTRGNDRSSTRGGLVTVLLEISPEQKTSITKLIKSIFPSAKIEFKKDLAHKWRICKINLD